MNDVRTALTERVLILDGAMGTLLQERGLAPGGCPEEMNRTAPDAVVGVHAAYADAGADILVATLGKALGVNGGYVVATAPVIAYLRETSPFYIYSNPITAAEAAAAEAALSVLDSFEGHEMLTRMRGLTGRFRNGLSHLGYEVLGRDHPITPLMVRDTAKTAALVDYLFAHNILATGLNYPVVPRGDEEIRFQVAASHTEQDIDYVLQALSCFSG